jgi:hypothetical protein
VVLDDQNIKHFRCVNRIQARVERELSERVKTLLLELAAMSILFQLSQSAWSPTLKAHVADFLADIRELESELNSLGLGLQVN